MVLRGVSGCVSAPAGDLRASGGRVGHRLTQGSAGRRSASSTVTGECGGPSQLNTTYLKLQGSLRKL